MIRVTVMYPRTEGASFDADYWVGKHMPLLQELCGDGLLGLTCDTGIAGGAPGAPSAYFGIAGLTFESVEGFQSSMGPHMGEILGDIPNYTDVTPVVEVLEVRL